MNKIVITVKVYNEMLAAMIPEPFFPDRMYKHTTEASVLKTGYVTLYMDEDEERYDRFSDWADLHGVDLKILGREIMDFPDPKRYTIDRCDPYVVSFDSATEAFEHAAKLPGGLDYYKIVDGETGQQVEH